MFHNIFQEKNKSKKQEQKRIKIVADIHEKNSLVPANLIDPEIELMISPLEIGDYLISDIIIERKTYSDFISSLISKRLIQQLIQMQKYDKKLLILEGEREKDKFIKVHPNAIKGMILSCFLDYDIAVITTKDSLDTANFLKILAKKQLKGLQKSSLHGRKPQTKKEQKQYILESFPNIGPKKAKHLLKKFGSIKNIINTTPESLEKEIGKNAKIFYELLN